MVDAACSGSAVWDSGGVVSTWRRLFGVSGDSWAKNCDGPWGPVYMQVKRRLMQVLQGFKPLHWE